MEDSIIFCASTSDFRKSIPFEYNKKIIMKDYEIREILLNFVCQNFMVEVNEINLDESLVDQGVIDSLGLIEISSFIEKQFSFKIREDQMMKENFGSVHKIVKFISDNVNHK